MTVLAFKTFFFFFSFSALGVLLSLVHSPIPPAPDAGTTSLFHSQKMALMSELLGMTGSAIRCRTHTLYLFSGERLVPQSPRAFSVTSSHLSPNV